MKKFEEAAFLVMASVIVVGFLTILILFAHFVLGYE